MLVSLSSVVQQNARFNQILHCKPTFGKVELAVFRLRHKMLHLLHLWLNVVVLSPGGGGGGIKTFISGESSVITKGFKKLNFWIFVRISFGPLCNVNYDSYTVLYNFIQYLQLNLVSLI